MTIEPFARSTLNAGSVGEPRDVAPWHYITPRVLQGVCEHL